MKLEILILLILLTLILSACSGTAHLNNEETRTICVPYCNERNMSVNMDHSITYQYTIVCNCDSIPIMRINNR